MKKIKKPKFFGALLMALAIITIVPTMASAHCDTMDGPVVGDATKAMESNNPSYIQKWVQPDDEKEINRIFDLTMKVRKLSPEAQELADNYLFENLVRKFIGQVRVHHIPELNLMEHLSMKKLPQH
jgi:hypothetical protein